MENEENFYYENTPIQILKILQQKGKKNQIKNSDIFSYFSEAV